MLADGSTERVAAGGCAASTGDFPPIDRILGGGAYRNQTNDKQHRGNAFNFFHICLGLAVINQLFPGIQLDVLQKQGFHLGQVPLERPDTGILFSHCLLQLLVQTLEGR